MGLALDSIHVKFFILTHNCLAPGGSTEAYITKLHESLLYFGMFGCRADFIFFYVLFDFRGVLPSLPDHPPIYPTPTWYNAYCQTLANTLGITIGANPAWPLNFPSWCKVCWCLWNLLNKKSTCEMSWRMLWTMWRKKMTEFMKNMQNFGDVLQPWTDFKYLQGLSIPTLASNVIIEWNREHLLLSKIKAYQKGGEEFHYNVWFTNCNHTLLAFPLEYVKLLLGMDSIKSKCKTLIKR